MTVDEWTRAWAELPRGRTRSTVDHNLSMVAGFRARFGARELGSLTPFEVRRWAGEHPGAVRYVKTLLADAVEDGLLAVSPAAGLRVERGTPRGRDVVPALEQVDALAGSTVGLMTESAAWTGLRQSELTTLTVEQVLGSSGRLRVVGKGGRVRTVAVLERGQVALGRALLEAGDRELVFATPRGHRWTRHSLGKVTRPVWAGLGVPGSWHGLRHFHATWLLDRGASYQDVAVQLGHFDDDGRPNIELVQRVYGHPSHEEALARLEGLGGA